MRKALILLVALAILSPAIADAQTRRRSTPRRSAPSSAAKTAAEVKAACGRIAAQIKTLTHFLYLYGSVAKGIESVEQAARNNEASPAAIEQNERNKIKVRESIRNVRDGLEKLEVDLRSNPLLRNYHAYVSGVARLGETAENHAAANRFDQAGRSLLQAVDQLSDALVMMR